MSAEHIITEHLDLWTGAVTHKSGAGRGRSGKNGKIELTGIKKLRELILELAVRGKLVEQNSNDEPASVLLERITEEKARLVEEGKIKKTKKTASALSRSTHFPLPSRWSWVALGELVNLMDAGWSPACSAQPAEPDEWGVIKTTAVQVMKYLNSESKKLPANRTPKEQYEICRGDILITRAGPKNRVGISCVVKETRAKLMISDKIIRFRLAEEEFSKDYICLCLNAGETYQYLEAAKSGMAESQMNISQDKLKAAPIPLCSANEQHRIAEKVDELMALCDRLEQQVGDQLEAHDVLVDTLLDALTRSSDAAETAEHWARIAEHFDTLFTTEASIDKLKQAVLQLAVMGKLVPQDPNDEPASVLLEKIAEEKARLVKEGKIKKPKDFPEFDLEQLPASLPVNWSATTLSHLGTFCGGKTPSKSKSNFWNGDIPWVTPKDMKLATINDTKDHVTEIATASGGLELLPKTTILFVVRSGILRRAFPTAITQIKSTINQDLKGLQLFIPNMARYVQIMSWGFEKFILQNLTKTGTTVESLKFNEFSSQPFPFPPLAEQHRIVAKVDELMTLCDRLKARLGKAGETRAHLAEAVVKRAVS